MKILFVADLHLKLGAKNVPKDWATARYIELFKQINSVEADLLILAGDVFDKIPNMMELSLYFEFVNSISIKTIIFSGNHEATKKGHTFLTSLSLATTAINPLVEIVDEVIEYAWGTVLPYSKLHTKNVFDSINKFKPLFTHVRGEIPPHVKPEIDLNLLNDFPVVYAGDLHSHSNTQRNIVYPGSPLTTSFHRNEVDTGYLLIEGSTWTWHKFDLPQLIRKTVTDPADMIETEYNHTIYELEGDLLALAEVRNSDLLDKKIVRRVNEAALLLRSDMTVKEELSEYLLYILELPEDKVSNIVGVFTDHDNIEET